MIPKDFITEWRASAPWVEDSQVEQDLVISRAIVEIFSRPELSKSLAFRGGTAIYKLHLTPAARYSEDIDLVQTQSGPIGPVTAALRAVLDPWLGSPAGTTKANGATLRYRFTSEGLPSVPLRLKIEVNTREHASVFGLTRAPFAVDSRWFRGAADVVTYSVEELLATKLRALYQRKKGRDLFDLAFALERGAVDPARVVEGLRRYMQAQAAPVTRAMFERNLELKLRDPGFAADIRPLLLPGTAFDPVASAQVVRDQLIARLPGAPWRGGREHG